MEYLQCAERKLSPLISAYSKIFKNKNEIKLIFFLFFFLKLIFKQSFWKFTTRRFSLTEILKNTLYGNRRSEIGQALKSIEISKYIG